MNIQNINISNHILNNNKTVKCHTCPELLAPAGSMDAFLGAIHAGADAVYMGGKQFGARAYATNFTVEELIYCIRYAHINGRKVYLTINTLTKEEELDSLYHYLSPLYENGLDGVIIQDIGVFRYISKHFPDIERHVSTQMTVTCVEDALFFKEMGAVRIVPARELSLEEIKSIKAATEIELECFIHGAMCYSYSGQCLFSSILGERSGNRGRCAQPCRLPYTVETDDKPRTVQHPLSLKDMCTLEHIPALIEAGIDSFKIEGRMKSPEYAAGVTAIYRKYMDDYYKNRHKSDYQYRVNSRDINKLSALYLRTQRHDGYYFKHNGADMVTLDNPSYAQTDEQLASRIRHEYIECGPKSLPINISGYFCIGQPAVLHFTWNDITVSVEGTIVSKAQKQPMSAEDITNRLCKLGNTFFKAEECDIYVDENCFCSVRDLNNLRRSASDALEEAVSVYYDLTFRRKLPTFINENAKNIPLPVRAQTSPLYSVSCTTMEQFMALTEMGHLHKSLPFNRVILDGDLFLEHYKSVTNTLQDLPTGTLECYIGLPYILRARDKIYMEQLTNLINKADFIKGVCVANISGLAMMQNSGFKGKYLTDAGFYLWNSESIGYWKDIIDEGTLPLELHGKAQKALTSYGLDFDKIIYGRIPMMITANCAALTTGGCMNGKQSKINLIDRYRKTFPVRLNCQHCYNIIYNTVPLSLHQEMHKWVGYTNMRIQLTTENKAETSAVLNYFKTAIEALSPDVNALKELPAVPFEYTTGHERRGAL